MRLFRSSGCVHAERFARVSNARQRRAFSLLRRDASRVQNYQKREAVTSGAAAGPAGKCEVDEPPWAESHSAADDGGKTPDFGSNRIQGWENDATLTPPKLRDDLPALARAGGDVRVQVGVVTLGRDRGFSLATLAWALLLFAILSGVLGARAADPWAPDSTIPKELR